MKTDISCYLIIVVCLTIMVITGYKNLENKALKVEYVRTLCKESYKSGQFNQAFYGGNEWLYKNDSMMIDSMIVKLFE